MATYRATFADDDRELSVAVDEHECLLDAAARAGLTVPASCLQGWCLSCAGKLQSGEVDQSEARRYFFQDRDAGFVLLCTAYPRSDLRVVVGQKEAMRQHREALGLPTPQG